jgi:RNA polymerase sigma-70 factor (ECF subfamily)
MTIRDPLGSAGEAGLLPLVRAVREGDRAAADRLYAAVRPRLIRVALALGSDPETAADTVQESLWAAHRNLDRFDAGRASFEGWLSVILLRRLSNRRRSALRVSRLLAALRGQQTAQGGRGARAVEARLTLDKLLRRLTPRQREVIALYEIGELSADEVARLLDLTPGGVRSIARDARRRLREAGK